MGQNLVLNSAGAAVGGYAGIGASSVSALQSLTLPANVSLNAYNFNAANPLNVAGAANIAGSMYALQNQANVAAVFNLGSLNVLPGGVLTTALPTSYFQWQHRWNRSC